MTERYVSSAEPAYGMFEGPVMVRGRMRWVQDVKVIRDDKVIMVRLKDFGPASDYAHVTPMLMPSVGTDTVAQLQEFADKNREDTYWQKRSEEMLAGSTLIADHVRQAEQDWLQVRNRSVLGPAITVQRDLYSQSAAARKLSEARQKTSGIVPQRGRK